MVRLLALVYYVIFVVYYVGLYVWLPAIILSLPVSVWAYYDATCKHYGPEWEAIGENRTHWVERLHITTVTVVAAFFGWAYLFGPYRKFRRLVRTG